MTYHPDVTGAGPDAFYQDTPLWPGGPTAAQWDETAAPIRDAAMRAGFHSFTAKDGCCAGCGVHFLDAGAACPGTGGTP
jgi:hypothetical protein